MPCNQLNNYLYFCLPYGSGLHVSYFREGSSGAGMGLHRHYPFLRRRIHRPSVLWNGCHCKVAPEVGLPRCCGSAAKLEGRPEGLPQAGPPAPVLRPQCRCNGFHGEPLHRLQAPKARRRLHPGRQGRCQAGLRRNGLHQDPKGTVSGHTRCYRRHRSIPQAPYPLRLLERLPHALSPGHLRGRLSLLRYGRTPHAGTHPRHRKRLVQAQNAADPANCFLCKREMETGPC